MPIYEYTCKKCKSDFELLIRGDEKPRCPSCESASLEKRLSVPAAHASASATPEPCQQCPGSQMGNSPCGMGGCGLV